MKKAGIIYLTIILIIFSLTACKSKASPNNRTGGALSKEESITPFIKSNGNGDEGNGTGENIKKERAEGINKGNRIEDNTEEDNSAMNLSDEVNSYEVLPTNKVTPKLEFKDVLGEFTTSYKTSSESRKQNIENAAEILNGITISPGETFSTYNAIKPISEDNGYSLAHAYLGGKIIESVGGGICQISSTLYNAVLFAELEVVERSSHSMTVSYIDLGRDAALAEELKDFKFKNNLKHSIVIKAETAEGTLHFSILGEEERKNNKRKIEFVPVITKETAPPEDVVTYDNEKPAEYMKVTQSAHTGYEVELYKVIYEDGKETDRVKVNTSVYLATPQYITVGGSKKN